MKKSVIELIPQDSTELKEKILVVAASALPYEEGVFPRTENDIVELIRKHGSYQLRNNTLEQDKNFKQVIPYIVVKDTDKYFFANRSARGSENRLRMKGTMAFGGHVRAEDVEGRGLLEWGKRELEEELKVKSQVKSVRFLGLVNRLRDEVDLVHVGLLILATVEGREVEILEKDKFSGSGWLRLEELRRIEHIEGWSRLVIDSGLV
jgi:predicted NUDIX family phosphoesterase